MSDMVNETLVVGDRVEIPAYTAWWMRGDRFGVVDKVNPPAAYFLPSWVAVRLNRSGANRLFIANDCQKVASNGRAMIEREEASP